MSCEKLHKFYNVWGSLLNAIWGEKFEKMQFDPSLQLGTKEYLVNFRFFFKFVSCHIFLKTTFSYINNEHKILVKIISWRQK